MSATTCRICGHAAFLKAGRRPPREWDYRCREGCQCTPTYCRPIRGGDATSKEQNSMSEREQSADDFLSGGGGAPSAKFAAPGARVEGSVTGWEMQQQRDFKTGELKFWKDGNKMMQLAVTLQTTQRDPSIQDDDGRRRVFVKGQMKQAMQESMKAAGARLEEGAYLVVTYTHDGEAKRGESAPKQYRVEYTPAGPASLQQPDPAAAYNLPPAPQQAYSPQPAPATQAVPGLTAEQVAAAQSDPAMAALLAQLQARPAAPAAAPTAPPF